MKNFAEVAKKNLGEKVAVLCARYQYRGRLAEVTEDCLVISNAMAVEVSGRSESDKPNTEDPVNGSVAIKLDAIEILYQPRWCEAPLPGEDGWVDAPNNN